LWKREEALGRWNLEPMRAWEKALEVDWERDEFFYLWGA
jgi:hypothetical protein